MLLNEFDLFAPIHLQRKAMPMVRKRIALTASLLLLWAAVATAGSPPAPGTVEQLRPPDTAPATGRSSPAVTLVAPLGDLFANKQTQRPQKDCAFVTRAAAETVAATTFDHIERRSLGSGRTTFCDYVGAHDSGVGIAHERYVSASDAKRAYTYAAKQYQTTTLDRSRESLRTFKVNNRPVVVFCENVGRGQATALIGKTVLTIFVQGAQRTNLCKGPLTAMVQQTIRHS